MKDIRSQAIMVFIASAILGITVVLGNIVGGVLVDVPEPVECLSDTIFITPNSTVLDSVIAILALHARDSTSLIEVSNLVMQESQRARLDPIMVAHIIRVENPWLINDIASSAGAVGIMQIMPFHKNTYACFGSLTDNATNICLGTQIFRDYLERSLKAALLRYNGCQYAACAGYATKVTEAF